MQDGSASEQSGPGHSAGDCQEGCPPQNHPRPHHHQPEEVHSPAYSAEAANKGLVDKEGAFKTISEFTQACDRKCPDFPRKHSFQLDFKKKKDHCYDLETGFI